MTSTKSFRATIGKRAGYIQLAESRETLHYADISDQLLLLAKSWCIELEKLGAKRVYWIILSEQLKQIHIHLYPRWSDDEVLRGIDLFNQRDLDPQPIWTETINTSLDEWASRNDIEIITS